MKRKLNVAVLMGGKSSEHEISLISGAEVTKNLNSKKYNALPIVVSRNGITWQLRSKNQFMLNKQKNLSSSNAPRRVDHASIVKENEINLAFIAMHGANGEDGTIQGFLKLLGLSYTGSGVLSSSLCMDKNYSKTILTQIGINVPKGILIKKGEPTPLNVLKFPVFVKPSDQGSSVGSSIARNRSDFNKALKKAFAVSKNILVEEYINGTEVTCAILGNDKPKALPLIEIVSKNDLFDYESKYDPKLSEEICPARISKSLTEKAQKIALRAYKALNCQVFGRVDMIVKGKDVYVLEINTIPGLTPVSLFPKAATTAGYSYSQLLDKIIDLSLQKND